MLNCIQFCFLSTTTKKGKDFPPFSCLSGEVESILRENVTARHLKGKGDAKNRDTHDFLPGFHGFLFLRG